jgi:hypothetical protein
MFSYCLVVKSVAELAKFIKLQYDYNDIYIERERERESERETAFLSHIGFIS